VGGKRGKCEIRVANSTHVLGPGDEAVYRPPSALSELFDHFEKLIKTIDNENNEMYTLDDLNCDLLNQIMNLTFLQKINSLYELYQLSQLIDDAARVTIKTTSLIDHIATNTPEKISDCGVIHAYRYK
jgi:superfamily II RNA helicase